ncbi:MAG: MFS transporter [Hyphomicrobiaceae bacterium]
MRRALELGLLHPVLAEPVRSRRMNAPALGHVAKRLAAFYGALFLTYGIQLPYFPLWLAGRGLTAAEIGIVIAAPMFVRLVATPALAVLVDRSGNRHATAIVLVWIGFAAILPLTAAHSFWVLLLASLVLSVAHGSVLPLIDTLVMVHVKTIGLDYGRVRLWGSLAFVAGNLIGGTVIDKSGAAAVIWLMAAGAAATVAAGHLLPAQRPAAEEHRRLRPIDAFRLAGSRMFLLFLLAAGCVQASHGVYYAFGTLHWHAQDLSAATAGILWAVGVVAEIALFAVSGAAVRLFGPLGLLMAGAGAAVVRWSAMALDPSLSVLVGLQMLHGLTYGATHLGAVHLIARHVPETQSVTAQALYATVGSLATGLTILASGPLFVRFAGGSYLLMAAFGLASAPTILALRRMVRS